MPAPPTEENLRTALKESANQLMVLHQKFRGAMNREGDPDTAGAREAENQIRDTRAVVCSIVDQLAGLQPDNERFKRVADELEQLHATPSNVKRIVREIKLLVPLTEQRDAPGAESEEKTSTLQHEKAGAEMAEADAVSDVPTVPKKGSRRERGPNLEECRNRVELEDMLRGELATIWERKKKYLTLDKLKSDTSHYELWKIISSAQEQKELLEEPFRPRVYARVLVARKYGVKPDAIKKSRAKLRAASK